MKLLSAGFAATAALALLLTGCSSEDQQSAENTVGNVADSIGNAAEGALSSAQSAAPGIQSSAESAADNAGSVFDDAKRSTFVAAYKAQFSALSEGRSDEDIESLLTSICQQIDDGKAKDAIVTDIQSQATNNGNEPGVDEAGRIYDQAQVACP
ncbi:MAG: hypothetical protein WBA00_13940 [Rhodococcus sp. (in: high G+C Gram-positive bacteria)]